MTVTSNPNTFAVHQAAQAIGAGVHSVRRWCDYHHEYLSAGARPATGQARRLTGRDIEVLRSVRDMRAQGMTTPAINSRLANMAFADVDDVAITPTSQEAPGTPEAGLQVLQHLETVLRPYSERLASVERRQRDTFTAFAAGVIVASVFFLIIVVIAWIYGG